MNRRQKKIAASVILTVAGIAAITLLANRVETIRDTDLADASADVGTEFRHAIPQNAPKVMFVNVAEEVGINFRHGAGSRNRLLPEDTGSGLAWGDYDADGDPDLYLVNYPQNPGSINQDEDSNRLYRNDNGLFVDVTEEAGVGDAAGFGMGASFADYDNDGDLDLYVTNRGANRLFRNDGHGRFEEVAEDVGVAGDSWSAGVAWGDVDHDGDLDLYVTNYIDYDAKPEDQSMGTWEGVPVTLNPNSYDPVCNNLYLNDGRGHFVDSAKTLGVENSQGRSLAATMFDFDQDGWLDIYVNNDVSQNALFRNLGSDAVPGASRFIDASAMTGTADPRGSMGISVGDVSGPDGKADGLADLFITHWVAQENALYVGKDVGGGDVEYRDRVRRFRLGEISTDTVGWGSAMVDLDLDGLTDIVVANGSTLEQRDRPGFLRQEPIFLFWRNGSRFFDLAPKAGKTASSLHDARGLAAADFDGDGDVDLAINVNRGKFILLRNETPTSHRGITVRLAGPPAALFGARIQVKTSSGTSTHWYGADASYLSMHHRDIIVGLKNHKSAEKVTVSWADGKQTIQTDVPSGLTILTYTP